jgi:hypothetical protein
MLSDRHRELIDQARLEDRSRQAARQQDRQPPLPNRTGARDPKTGTHAAIYPDQSQAANGRKLYDAQASAPIQALRLGDGSFALLGPKSEPYSLSQPEPIIYRSQATPGPLKTNEVGYLKGQVFNYPKPSQKKIGIFMWLDINWLWNYRVPAGESPVSPESFNFLYGLLQYFNAQVLHTLPKDDRFFDASSYSLSEETISEALKRKKVQVRFTPPTQAKGTYFLPLLDLDQNFTDEEFAALKRIAKLYGLLVCGEWNDWIDYDNRVLRGLGIRDTVVAEGAYEGESQGEKDIYVPALRGFPKSPFIGDAYGAFTGLRKREILVKSKSNDRAVFAYFQI